jgi:hypothetical protein
MNLQEAHQAWAEGKKVRKRNWKRDFCLQINAIDGNDSEINRLFMLDNDSDGDVWELVP